MSASFYDDLVRYTNILYSNGAITAFERSRIIKRIVKAARKKRICNGGKAMNTLLSVLPRFVLPDNTVVMPEDIQGIYHRDIFDDWIVPLKNGDWADVDEARIDRATGHMVREQMIYENDILNGSHMVYYEPEKSQWRVGHHATLFWFVMNCNVIITGHVPYEEEINKLE